MSKLKQFWGSEEGLYLKIVLAVFLPATILIGLIMLAQFLMIGRINWV